MTTNSFSWLSSGSLLRLGFGASSGNTFAEIDNLNGGGISNGTLVLQGSGGPVSIGTTSIASYSPLTVTGSDVSGNGANLTINNSSAPGANVFAGVQLETGGTLAGRFFGGTVANSSFGLVNGITMSAGTTSQDIGFRTGAAIVGSGAGPSMIIQSTGNVGIGTATPQAALDVTATGTASSFILVPRDSTANRPVTAAKWLTAPSATTRTTTRSSFSRTAHGQATIRVQLEIQLAPYRFAQYSGARCATIYIRR